MSSANSRGKRMPLFSPTLQGGVSGGARSRPAQLKDAAPAVPQQLLAARFPAHLWTRRKLPSVLLSD